MNKIKRITLTGAAASLACLANAQAAHLYDASASLEGQDRASQRDESKSRPGQPDGSVTNPAWKQAPCVCPAHELLGRNVKNTANENIGKIEDLVIQLNGEIGYAVLSFGGVMGVGDKLFAIPWSVLRQGEVDAMGKKANAPLILPIEKERLKNAPGFDKKNWPSLAAADWMLDVDTYYAKDRVPVITRPVDASAKKASLLKASELKGMNVQTPTGDKLGDIEDVSIDINGHVSYVVVSVGGFLGIGDTLVAVPWDALQITRDGDKKKIVLPTTKERLEKAPRFTRAKDKSSEMCDPVWIGTVYEYYSVPAYWSGERHRDDLPKNP